MQSLDSEQIGDEDSEIESELELHQESDQDEFLIQDANSLIVQDADTGEDDSEKQDEEEHDPFHLDEFEAEIEALLTDTDKPR